MRFVPCVSCRYVQCTYVLSTLFVSVYILLVWCVVCARSDMVFTVCRSKLCTICCSSCVRSPHILHTISRYVICLAIVVLLHTHCCRLGSVAALMMLCHWHVVLHVSTFFTSARCHWQRLSVRHCHAALQLPQLCHCPVAFPCQPA